MYNVYGELTLGAIHVLQYMVSASFNCFLWLVNLANIYNCKEARTVSITSELLNKRAFIQTQRQGLAYLGAKRSQCEEEVNSLLR